MGIALEGLQQDLYRIGDLQSIRYDKARTDLFPDGYLGHLYLLCRESKRRSGDGILTTLFAGNPASNFDSIVSYLAARPVIIMGKWIEDRFVEYGFAFPVIEIGRPGAEKAIFAGFGFFRRAWGTEEQIILAMLGLAYMFQEFDLQAIHGTAYPENVLPRKFMAQFGMKVVGEVPCYQLQGTKLVPGVVSSLLRSDFEAYVEDWLVRQYRAEGMEVAVTPEPVEDAVDPSVLPEQPELPLAWL
jgi:hypothetical protein